MREALLAVVKAIPTAVVNAAFSRRETAMSDAVLRSAFDHTPWKHFEVRRCATEAASSLTRPTLTYCH